MTKNTTLKFCFGVIGATLILLTVRSATVIAQTIQLKESAPGSAIVLNKSQSDSFQVPSTNGSSSSYSVVVENKMTPDGKVVQSKKVWQNGELVSEETKELDSSDEANNGPTTTIQLPNGQITSGNIFQSDKDDQHFLNDDIYGSAFEWSQELEKELKAQQELMQSKLDELRSRLLNGQNVAPLTSLFSSPQSTLTSKFWIGVTIGTIPEILEYQLPITSKEGVLIQFVVPDSPAAKAGLKRYDVIHKINGNVVASPAEVTKFIEEIGNQKAKLEFYRKGKLETTEISVEERPELSNILRGQPQNLNRNKNFTVVRPGLIVPSQDVEVSEQTSTEKSDPAENTDKTTPETTDSPNQPN